VKDQSLIYKIALSFIPLIGDINAKKLVAYVGSAEGIFKEKKSNLLKIPGIGNVIANHISNNDALKHAEEEVEFVCENNIKPLYYLDDDYPERLKNCPDGPVILYAKGEKPEVHPPKIISIVGTRHPSQEGIHNCARLIEELAQRHPELIIISGLAYGIDACAHKNALKHQLKTFAVVGHGLDMIYPSLHHKMANEMLKTGGWISDFPGNTKIEGQNFVKRNRIIAGLSDATVVIESAIKGGALTTADIANSYDREVFSFPGRVSDMYSKGCNALVKKNKAVLIETAKDLEYYMKWDIKKENKQQYIQQKLFVDLPDDEKNVLEVLKKEGEQTIDQLSNMLNIPPYQISPLLLNLEFSGLVRCLPGKVYKAEPGYSS
jgi:DNA processing protein